MQVYIAGYENDIEAVFEDEEDAVDYLINKHFKDASNFDKFEIKDSILEHGCYDLFWVECFKVVKKNV